MCKEFRSERLKGDKTILDHIKKKLSTHTVSKKNTEEKMQDRVIVLKKDRKIMICFLLRSRKRPKLNLEKYMI